MSCAACRSQFSEGGGLRLTGPADGSRITPVISDRPCGGSAACETPQVSRSQVGGGMEQQTEEWSMTPPDSLNGLPANAEPRLA